MLRIIAVIALTVMTAGCTGGRVEPTMTKDEALARVEELINDTVAIIEPRPRLDVDPTTLTPYRCIGFVGDDWDGRIYISRAYWLRGIPRDKTKLLEISQKVRRHWQQQGHVIEGISKDGMNIAARSRPDGFILSLSWTAGDVLGIGATSPCIWPHGTPEPSPSSELDVRVAH
ncbi:hypothetical protein [Thermobispora bispora]|uniref:hypothetical protein n=1 Tax=Thermobispora bispora TaxID=2006 RepID=UPI00194FC2F1|nr:hypothetical protein [Thermobispora bispora]MBX6167324.1 hypothetical protein [Thermobispora bispora]